MRYLPDGDASPKAAAPFETRARRRGPAREGATDRLTVCELEMKRDADAEHFLERTKYGLIVLLCVFCAGSVMVSKGDPPDPMRPDGYENPAVRETAHLARGLLIPQQPGRKKAETASPAGALRTDPVLGAAGDPGN